MNPETRAALVAMGQDMARAREVLAGTERRAILQVYRHEFQLRHVSKSPKEPRDTTTKKPEDAIAQSNRVADIADVLLADMEDGTPFPSAEEIKEKFECGIKTASNGLFTARYALRSAKAAANAVMPLEPVSVDDLSADEKSKLDRVIKQQLRKLQDGFHEAVKKEYQQFIVRMHADWKRKIEFAEKYSDGTRREKFPLTRKQFKELLFFTHPDRQEPSLRDRAAEKRFGQRSDRKKNFLSKNEKRGGARRILAVSEPGLYRIIARSHAAKRDGTFAFAFVEWITGAVLPSLRKTGAYTVDRKARALVRGLPGWTETREAGKETRKDFADTIQSFVAYAKASGSNNAQHYFEAFTKLAYKIAVGCDKPPHGRDGLGTLELLQVQLVEANLERLVASEIAAGTHYKQAFASVRERLQAIFAVQKAA